MGAILPTFWPCFSSSEIKFRIRLARLFSPLRIHINCLVAEIKVSKTNSLFNSIFFCKMTPKSWKFLPFVCDFKNFTSQFQNFRTRYSTAGRPQPPGWDSSNSPGGFGKAGKSAGTKRSVIPNEVWCAYANNQNFLDYLTWFINYSWLFLTP